MLFGAHVSIAGGVQKAPENAEALGCECFQFFSRSPRGGPAPELTEGVVDAFRAACRTHKQQAWYVHTPYYINLASHVARIRDASVRIIREELDRASLLGATAVMTHLGSAKDLGVEAAEQLVIESLRTSLDRYTGSAQLLLEIAAGSGMIIGDRFEALGRIRKALGKNVGICFDTQHAFASGYDQRTPETVRATFDAFDHIIGLQHLIVSHCNDSMVGLGERKDRHEHIGKGKIGIGGFRALVSEPRLANVNFVLETAPDAVADDLAMLKSLRQNAS